MENTLTEKSKTCSTIFHALDELELVDLALDDSIADG